MLLIASPSQLRSKLFNELNKIFKRSYDVWIENDENWWKIWKKLIKIS